MQASLLESEGSVGIIGGGVVTDAALSRSHARPFIEERKNKCLDLVQWLLFICLGVGLPLLIAFDKLPSDSYVESIIVWTILIFVGLIVFFALIACVVGSGIVIGKRRVVRGSFLERKDEEILLARQDAAKQAKLKDLQVIVPLLPPASQPAFLPSHPHPHLSTVPLLHIVRGR